MKKVSIIISNRNDTSMLSVTVRSCMEELKPIGHKDSEIVICDNSDEEVYRRLNSVLPTGYIRGKFLKVFRQDFPCLFTARETAAEKSSSEYIVCLDSHMISGRDMILDLVNFMDSKRDDPTVGFAHAPINWAHQHEDRSRHDRDISSNELGPWGVAYKQPRTITWKGMPWICRRDWFLDRDKGLGGYGALADHKLSWGGGDMHIGVKPWLLGFKNWAVPTSPGIHIGPFPKIDLGKNKNTTIVSPPTAQDKYRLYSASGVGPHTIGFLVSCYILGGEPMMERNRKTIVERFGNFINTEEWWEKAKEYGKDEKAWLDKRKVMSFEEFLETEPWNPDRTASIFNDWRERFKGTKSAQVSIKPRRWEVVKKIINSYNVKSVLEFGSGLSTILFDKLGLKVDSYETNKEYMDSIADLYSDNVKLLQWTGNGSVLDGLELSGRYDLAFVDGDVPRLPQYEIAKQTSKIVVVDDFGGWSSKDLGDTFSDWTRIDDRSDKLIAAFLNPKEVRI